MKGIFAAKEFTKGTNGERIFKNSNPHQLQAPEMIKKYFNYD